MNGDAGRSLDLQYQQSSKSNWTTEKRSRQRKGRQLRSIDRRLQKVEKQDRTSDAKRRTLYIVSRVVQRIGKVLRDSRV